MRYLIAGGALLLGAVAAAFFALPLLIDGERIERRLSEVVATATGRQLGVVGAVDVKLLPQPLLTMHRPTIGTGAEGLRLTADRLDLEVRLLPLLVGTLEVTDAHLVRPELRLAGDTTAELIAWLERLATREEALPWQRLAIVGGTLATTARGAIVQQIDAVIERDAVTGGSRVAATGHVGGSGRVELDAELASVPSGRPIPTQLRLALRGNDAESRLDFRGLVRLAGDGKGLDGRLALDLESPASLGRLLAKGDAGASPTTLAAAPVSLQAVLAVELGADRPEMRLDELTLTVDGQSLTGSAALGLGTAPAMALALAADRLTLPAATDPASRWPLGVLRALPAELAGTVELRAAAVEWRGQTLRQVSLDLALDGSGAAEITRASLLLPGPGDLAFTGRLEPSGSDGEPRLSGQLAVAVQEPAALVEAFATPPAVLRQSTTLSLETELIWAPSGVTLRGADLRLDALRAEGGIAWRVASDGRLPQLAARGSIDRLALDDLVAVDAPSTTLEAWLEQLTATDLALDLRIERASLGEARLGGLVVHLDGSDGRIAIERASFTDVAGSAVTVDGVIDARERSFALDLAIDLASLSRLLRLLGHEPSGALALLGPLNLRSTLEGAIEDVTVQATLDADQFRAAGGGRLSNWLAAPSGRIELRLDAADAAALVRQVGGMAVTDPLLQGPLAATIGVELDQGALSAAALGATLGDLELDLAAGRRTPETVQLDRFDLRIGALGADTAALLYRLATPPLGLVPGPPSAWLGYWPAQELDWRWLSARDMELALTLARDDPALPPIEVIGQVRDGLLTIPAFRYESERGLIEAGMALATRRGTPIAELAIDVAAQGLDITTVLEAAGVDPEAMTGGVDLEARMLSSGRSLRAMVANLQGRVELVMSSGRLGASSPADGGIPVDRLAGTLEVERGVVRPLAGGITFAGPDGTGRIDGFVDLLNWMVELQLAMDGQAGDPLVRQRFFGPLGEVSTLPPDDPAVALEPEPSQGAPAD